MPRPARPVTAAMFERLVADLRGELADTAAPERDTLLAGETRPRAFRTRAWVKQRITLHEAAELTGLAYNSLRVYRNQGDKARAGGTATYRSFPAESGGEGGGWTLGSLALWLATRQPGRVKGAAHGFMRGGRWPAQETYLPALRAHVRQVQARGGRVTVSAAAAELGVERALATRLLKEIGAFRARVTDTEALDYMREVAARGDRRVTRTELLAEMADAGMRMTARRAVRLYLSVGGRLPDEGRMDGPDPAPFESMRADGLITQKQVAAAYCCSQAHVYKSRLPRDDGLPPLIVAARWENGKPLYDPETLTHRRDMLAGPVRKGHPLAAELGTHHQPRRGIGHARKSSATRRRTSRLRSRPRSLVRKRPGCSRRPGDQR